MTPWFQQDPPDRKRRSQGRVFRIRPLDSAAQQMHSILLVVSKPESGRTHAEPAWQTVESALQLHASQARGVKMLCQNCWLIPAEQDGFSFFNQAIAIVNGARLRCRICVLRTPPDGIRLPASPSRPRRAWDAIARTVWGNCRRIFHQ